MFEEIFLCYSVEKFHWLFSANFTPILLVRSLKAQDAHARKYKVKENVTLIRKVALLLWAGGDFPTSEMSASSCRAVAVGVADGELLCCTRSGRFPMLP